MVGPKDAVMFDIDDTLITSMVVGELKKCTPYTNKSRHRATR